MRRLLVGLVVSAAAVLVPVWALAGNQEVAEKIALSLRQSGQLESYKVGVKYQDGTAWLRGQVTSREQMNAALRIAAQAPGVNRVVNDLTISPPGENASAAPHEATGALKPQGASRLAAAGRGASQAERVPTSFAAAPARQVAMAMPTMGPEQGVQPVRMAQPRPIPIGYTQGGPQPMPEGAGPMPQYAAPMGSVAPARYDQPNVPNYAWPSYAAYPNYAALTYPKQYSPTAWPYIGPFYPYPQVPLGWRKVTLEWHDGWWQLDFDDGPRKNGFISGLFRPCK
jgi:hypothetical protein